MIKTKINEDTYCNACRSNRVRGLEMVFRTSNSGGGMAISICEKCLVELKEKCEEAIKNFEKTPLVVEPDSLKNYKPPKEQTDFDDRFVKQLTGRVIFCKGENFPYDGEIDFFCGPEEFHDGHAHICDGYDCYEQLRRIFNDMPEINIGAAESYHTVELNGKSVDEVWEVIKSRLLEAGAVYRKDMESEEE